MGVSTRATVRKHPHLETRTYNGSTAQAERFGAPGPGTFPDAYVWLIFSLVGPHAIPESTIDPTKGRLSTETTERPGMKTGIGFDIETMFRFVM
jgi:hypothetical protein